MDRGVSVFQAMIAPAADGWRLDRALAEALPTLSRERLKVLINEGQVSIDGEPVREPARKAVAGATYDISIPAPTSLHSEAQNIPLVVAFEDEHLIVIDKPAGLVVHPACGNLDGTLVNALLHHCRGSLSGIGGVERPGIVHRIDKDTSGLMVAAKTDRAHAGLAQQFARHSIDRRYLAIVSGRPQPASGRIEGNIGRSSADRKKMTVVGAGQGKHAVTHYTTLTPLDDAALVECRLETGRTHQVRVHMASIGHSLLGDAFYGRASRPQRDLLAALSFKRQALHAAQLGFEHPVTSLPMTFESSMPADMQALFSHVRV